MTPFQRWFYLFALIIAGESIYMLPYMRRTFQTSMESVLQLSGTEIGLLNGMFGILALLCYFPSGWMADRFSARSLLSFSLFATAAGGFFMTTLPDFRSLVILHAVWGVTSILTFWGALIKATRYWGSEDRQGLGFGLLDGGRGVVGALLASVATLAFAVSASTATGLISVIQVYSLAPLIAGIVVLLALPRRMRGADDVPAAVAGTDELEEGSSLGVALRNPNVWLFSLIIFCAYFLFLGAFEFPAYVERAYDQTKAFGATLGTARDWMRPLAALGAGLLADRVSPSRTIGVAFALLMLTFGSLALVPAGLVPMWLLWGQVLLTAAAVFALRAVYFALLQELRIPLTRTGTVVGIVSFVGFLPDTFAHLLSGVIVDASAGAAAGYQLYFAYLAGVAAVGWFVTWVLRQRLKQ